MRKLFIGLFFFFSFSFLLFAQKGIIEGYVIEDGSQKSLNEVKVKISQVKFNHLIANTTTNEDGFFSVKVPKGNTYLIETTKDHFNPQKTTLVLKRISIRKKFSTKIKMVRKPSSQKVVNNIAGNKKSNRKETAKIITNTNNNGVLNGDLVTPNNPYIKVTNATRLADENYAKAADKEMLKRQPTPTAYNSPVKITRSNSNSQQRQNRNLPKNYEEERAINKKISPPSPQFGETLVAFSANIARTQSVSNYFTGYKIEFLTSLSELPRTHEIFKRHGNIAMEQKPNGIYSYLLGQFNDKKIAETFLKECLLIRYPNADLVYFKNGRREIETKSKKPKTKSLSAPPR